MAVFYFRKEEFFAAVSRLNLGQVKVNERCLYHMSNFTAFVLVKLKELTKNHQENFKRKRSEYL